MDTGTQDRAAWRALFGQRAFRYLFAAMLISIFGSGLSQTALTWHILDRTGSTLQVSLMMILVTLPGLLVPPFGGVVIDRVDRRHLGVALDLARAAFVLTPVALAARGRLELWHLYAMVTLVGVGFAVYWSSSNALMQEVVPPGQLVGANAGALIAVQGGMMTAGAVVGFLYERGGIALILAMDGATYFVSAFLLLRMRSGRFPPRAAPAPDGPVPRPRGAARAFVLDLKEGLRYLRGQPRVFSLGLTHACMMAGVVSSNVLVVALARDVLRSGPQGFGYIEAGWAVGAIAGGIASGPLACRFPPFSLMIAALAALVGHALFPYLPHLALAVGLMTVFGACRALAGVLAQSAIMSAVPTELMGRTQSAFSFLSTLLQVLMALILGWLAQGVGIKTAFLVLGGVYGGALLAALRARALTAEAAASAERIRA